MAAITKLLTESATGMALVPSTDIQLSVQHALPEYGSILWKYHTSPCFNRSVRYRNFSSCIL